jgi:hypothetical protein
MAKLLGRTSGWNDCEQLKQMEILFRVMNKTKTIKIGRGKKAYTKEEFVYQSESDDEVRDNINYSIKHYKELCLNSENTKRQ